MADITIRLPKGDWQQIVSDIENMCGVDASDIEILQSVVIVEDQDYAHRTCGEVHPMFDIYHSEGHLFNGDGKQIT